MEVTVPTLAEGELYHAFIAHSSEDRQLSHVIKATLDAKGFTCCHADTDFIAGKSVVDNITDNIQSSQRVILLVSRHFLDSDWTSFETMITVQKQVSCGKRLMVSILIDDVEDVRSIPVYIKGTTYLTYGEENFWPRLVRSLTDDVGLADCIPAGEVAHGLAWSYFYGFLNLVLPGLFTRIESSSLWSDEVGRVARKMIIIMPRSCLCPGSLTQLDDRLTFHGHLPFKANRAGNIDRDYKSSIYKVTDDGEEYFAVLELATPLLSLYEMEQGAIAGLNTEDKLLQMNTFCIKLCDILEHPNNRQCNNKTILLKYEDQRNQPTDCLSHTIATSIRAQLAEAHRHGNT